MMYDNQNIGYQMPSAPYPMMQQTYGGYPAGYPPVAMSPGYGIQNGCYQMPVMIYPSH